MQSAPLPPDEARRLEVLRGLGLMDSPPEESFDTLVECAARISGCPIATLTLLDAQRQWFKAVHGMPLRETPRAVAFCAHTILDEALFEVPDALVDARFLDNPLVTGVPGARFYAGVPLSVDGVRLGALAVFDTRPRTLSLAERELLMRLSRTASELLQSRQRMIQLHTERERMVDFARASGDWMWEVDAQLRVTWIAGSFEAYTQLPSAEVIGQRIEDSPLLDGQGALIEGPTFHQLLALQQPFARVTTLRHGAQDVLRVSRSAVPWYDAHGEFAGFRGTARDVSDQIQIQHQLHAQDALLRKLASQVPGVIFQFQLHADGRTSYPYASDAALSLFGLEPAAQSTPGASGPGGDPSVPLRLVHPDDRPGYLRSLYESARTLKPWLREYRITRGDGVQRWMETRAAPERLDDGSTLWHGFTADVTERKQIELALRESQERVQLAFEAAGIGIAQFSLQDGTVRLDHRACEHHGLAPLASSCTAAEWLQTVLAEDRPAAQALLQPEGNPQGPVHARYRVQRPDGSCATLDLVASRRLDAYGQPTGLVASCRDITAGLASERLQRDKEAAERANRAKSEFLSRVSHELRTPLNGILGFTQLMLLDRVHPLQGDQKRRLDSVLRAGRHLLDLINDVLDLTRIESEDFSLRAVPVDARAAVDACLTLVQPLAQGSGVRLQGVDGGACWVQADPRALEQVLMNLLSNAIKYNRPDGTVRVVLDRGDGVVTVAVHDSGQGLTAEQQGALFQPFNRLGAERSRTQGSGLGLVISRDLVRAMQGQLQVQSRAGEGSVFSFTLPAAAVPLPQPQQDGDAAHLPPPRVVLAHAKRRTVLYVEDEPLNVVLLQEMFKRQPRWTLQVVPDGRSALDALARRKPDLVLIDMNLPDMSGLALLTRLRSNPDTQALRCVALSADAMHHQIAAARAAGVDDYWTKPIDVAQVWSALDRLLT